MKVSIKMWIEDEEEPRIINQELIQEKNEIILNSEEFIDIHNIGRFLLQIEKSMFTYFDKSGKKKKRKSPLRIRRIEIPILTYLTDEKKENLSNLLKEIFLFIYNTEIEFTFIEIETEIPINEEIIENKDAVLLFSGGLDSILGYSYCRKKYNNPLLLYIDQKPKLRPIIQNIMPLVEEKNILSIKGPQIFSGFFANTAGIFYILNGLIFAHKHKAPLVIAECGVTRYQPRFGPLNDVTFTTHPVIVDIAKNISKIFLNYNPTIIFPFDDNTKSEMVNQYGEKDIIALSHSCLSTNDMSGGGKIIKNCGSCYACIIRRLGIIVAADDPTEYTNLNFFDNEKLAKKSFLPLLEFCYIILKNFNLLDYPQKEKIIKYNKEDLFKRFALDTFSALYKISEKQELPVYIQSYLDKFDKKIFENRIKKLMV